MQLSRIEQWTGESCGRTKTKLLDWLPELGFGDSRLYQFVQLFGPLCRIGGAREPETCRSRPLRHKLGLAHVGIPRGLYPAGAGFRRAGRPALTAAVDCLGCSVLELRNGAVGICGQLPHPFCRACG